MKHTKSKTLWTSTIFAFLLLGLIGSCKKDNFVETKGLCPVVITTNPLNLATSVPLNQIITATFNEKMNPATINQNTFTLRNNVVLAGTLTYDDINNKLSFAPSSPLVINTTYTCKITTAVKDVNGNALQADYIWTFSTGAVISPMVVSTDPFNNETGVALNKIVSANFNMLMDTLTIVPASFFLKQGTNLVAGKLSHSGVTSSFKPTSNLLPNTVYTATITTAAKNLAGTSIASNYVWSFTTGSILAPTVISTDPANNDSGVVLSKTVTATFSEAMEPLTINSSSFGLKEGINIVTGVVTYTGNTASFNPIIDLLPNTIYTATITTLAKSLSGVFLANNYVWTFKTESSIAPKVILTDPINNATNVPLNKIISADFDMNMDPSTIDVNSFKLMLGATPVAGSVTYSGMTAKFTPNSNLLSGNTYTASITTLAKNLAGTPLASNYVWSFNTVAPLGPIKPDLKSVARFGIISGVGVSNNAGFSVINDMDVGIYPGARSSITGFPPATIVNGALYAADDAAPIPAMLLQAKLDLTAAYLYAEGATSPAPTSISGDQGGITLAPGIYKSTSTLLIQNGNLTLDAQGDVNAVWIFQIASDFTTVGGSPYPSGAGGNVILSGGAQAKNIFWQVGSSATIGDYTSFQGNILALTSITMNAYSQAVGRMLCSNGAVVLTSTNLIYKP